MEIVISVATEILSKLVDATIFQARYPFRFSKYVKDLEIEKETLQLKIDKVGDRAKEAEEKTEKVVSKVEMWQKEADFLIAKVVLLQEKAKSIKKSSCLKCCPNMIRRYSLAKQLEEMTNEIIKHRQVEFSQFSRLATLVGMNYFSSEGFVHFDSRQEAYDRLLKALKDDKVSMIGLYGMGGCGKTTLAKEVGKEVEKVFKKVVFVTVSNTIDDRKLQGKIASQLKLDLKEEEEPERARRLFMRLTGRERILIILDDVWQRLDFEEIGIPVAENQTSCTTLITTRKKDVCRVMKCKSIIPLKGLNEDEAWTLFQKNAEMFDDNFNNLKGLAREITKECGGLPVAIAAVASTLKGKPKVEWDEALKTLRDSSLVDIEEGLKNPYTCLQLSYDNLKNYEVAKSLFLLCSVFPEDYEISNEELTIIGVGLGLVGEVHSYQRARNQVMVAKNKLIDCCLLLKGYKSETSVQMHDLVRDVALWIANKENKLIMGPEKSQKALKEDMILMDNNIRYLWFDKVDEFPFSLDCPELEFLYVSMDTEHDIDIKDNFFNGMKKLRIFILKSHTEIQQVLQLPTSVHLTNNLRCLFLYNWSFGDISFIGSLQRLESLQLQFCSFDELPKCIMQQKKLRLLELWSCEIRRNPYEVIGRCSQLEALYFFDKEGTYWEDQVAAEFFDINGGTLALKSYCINLGKNPGYLNRQTKSLSVDDFETCISNATIKDLMQRAEYLCLRGIDTSCKNFIPDVVQIVGGGMSELTQLSLYDSDGMECIFDTRNHLDLVGIISNLTCLTIVGMKHLKTVCHGQPPQGPFVNLEYLRISNCSSLEYIIADEVNETFVDDSDYHRAYIFPFPKLKHLSIEECDQLEYLMPFSFTQSLAQLEVIRIARANMLKSVFGQSIYEDPSPNKFHIIEFSSLSQLELESLPNIVSICPENYHPTWPSMKDLRLVFCPQLNIMPFINHWIGANSGMRQADHIALEDLVLTQQETLQSLCFWENNEIDVIFHLEGLPNNGQQVKSSLDYLQLVDLHELRYIWMGPDNFLCLRNLGVLEIVDCKNLKVVFPTSIKRSLPLLETVNIRNCKELEEIVEEDDENQNLSNAGQLAFPNLTTIYIRQCHKLKHIFPVPTCRVLPKLRTLVIEGASQLEEVFGDVQEFGSTLQIPDLEFVILSQLPIFTTMIDLQSVKYMVVHESPVLTLTSTITPQEFFIEVETQAYFNDRWELKTVLENIIKSNEDCGRETTEQIDSKECGVESASECEHISSHAKTNESTPRIQAQINMQKLTPLASSRSKESVQRSAEEGFTSEIVKTIDNPLQSNASPNLTNSPTEAKSGLDIPTALPPSSTDLELINKRFPNNSLVMSHETNVNELKDPSAQKPNISDAKSFQGSVEQGSTTENAKIFTTPSTHLEPTSSLHSSLVTSLPTAHPHRQIKVNQIERGIDTDTEANPKINLQDIKDDGGQLPILSEHVANAVVDLEVCLMMPFKDIASSEANSLRLLTAVKFLSHLSIEDGILPHGLKAITESMLQDLPSILHSFKSVFGTINKFPKFLDEAQEKEARLKEQISMLDKEIEDCEAKLSSLQEEKKICDLETKEAMKEFESVRKEKSQMLEEQRKAQQKLFEIDYRWSVLCSQFLQNYIDVCAHPMMRFALEANIELAEDYGRETTQQTSSEETNQSVPKCLNKTMPGLEIPVEMPTSSANPQLIKKQLPDYPLVISTHETPSSETVRELVSNISASESSLKDQQQPLAETEIVNNETPPRSKACKGSIEGFTSENAEIVTSSTPSVPTSSLLSSLDTSQPEAFPQRQIKINQPKIDNKDDGGQLPIPSIVIAATTKDEPVAKAYADLQVWFKMPFKDIAGSEANSLRFLTALNFISHLSFEDGVLPHGLKATIESLLQDLPSILYSFKIYFASINKVPMFLDEIQVREAKLKEQITRFEREIEECKAKLLSLQLQIKKCVAETIEVKKEFDNVRKEKSEMVEDQRKAQQQLLEIDYKWSVLCSQFQLISMPARNLF